MTTTQADPQVAKRIRMAMGGKNLNQSELAAELTARGVRVSREMVRRIMMGERDVELSLLRLIAEICEVREDWLLGHSTNPGYFNSDNLDSITPGQTALLLAS